MRPLLVVSALLTLAACDGCGGGVSQVRPVLIPPGSPTDFGTIPVLNFSELDLDVSNAGRALLEIRSVSLANDDGIFQLMSSLPAELEGGETERLKMRFTPLAEQRYENTLIIETNDEELPRAEIALVGTGSTRAIVAVEPETLDFNRVAECGSSVLLLTIKSQGTADLVLNSIGFTEDSHPAFGFVGSTTTPATIPTTDPNGLPGEIQLTVRAAAPAGAEGELTGTIRLETTDPERREVLIPLRATVNKAPVATIGPTGNAAPGQLVTLDGANSLDPDGDDPITYTWTLRSKPLASNTVLANADTPLATMTLDPSVPGAYEVQLEVTDAAGAKSCQPARATVVASPAQKLLVEMFWNNPRTDLDLHVTRNPAAPLFTAPDDCYFQNRTPDWGVEGDSADDPEFGRDALTGYGPETWGYVDPVDGVYRVWAVLQNPLDTFGLETNSTVTVRVYQFGVLKAEAVKTLTTAGEQWPALDISWPDGAVTVVQQ